MRLLSPLTAGLISSAILATGLAVPAVAAPSPMTVESAPSASVSTVLTPRTTPFKVKTVTAIVPTRFYYTKNINKTTVVAHYAKKITAKGTDTAVFAKINGNWKKVPYVYVKRTNTLKYDEGLRIKYGMAKDPLGAAKASNMYPNDPPDQDGGGVTPGTCDPTTQPCGSNGGNVSVVTGSYDTNPAAVATAGGNYAGEAVAAINTVRAGAGLAPVAWCPAAAQAATGWANYLTSNGLYTHVANGSDPGSRMVQLGVAVPLGETIVAGRSNASSAVDAWVNSPAHVMIMKHPYATHVGVGIAPDTTYGGVMWVANFAKNGGAC